MHPLQLHVDGDGGTIEAVVTPGVEAVEDCCLWLVCEDQVDLVFGLSNGDHAILNQRPCTFGALDIYTRSEVLYQLSKYSFYIISRFSIVPSLSVSNVINSKRLTSAVTLKLGSF